MRDEVQVRLDRSPGTFLATDPYVRKFWVAIIGPSSLMDLLRLSQAARRQEKVLRPLHLRPLLEAGLVKVDQECVIVADRIPALPPNLVARLPLHLRRQHAALSARLADGAHQGESEGSQFSGEKADRHPDAGLAPGQEQRQHPGEETSHPRSGKLAG